MSSGSDMPHHITPRDESGSRPQGKAMRLGRQELRIPGHVFGEGHADPGSFDSGIRFANESGFSARDDNRVAMGSESGFLHSGSRGLE